MILKPETFTRMLTHIRAIYGPSWRADLEQDEEAKLLYFQNCQELIADELASILVRVYCTRRAKAPCSPYDILEANIEKKLENAKSSEFIIAKLIAAIQNYDSAKDEALFASCDEYLLQNVIPMLPCPDGIKSFYLRNRHSLEHLALHSPDDPEKELIYKKLGFDYREQLVVTERKAMVNKIHHNALPSGNANTPKQLED